MIRSERQSRFGDVRGGKRTSGLSSLAGMVRFMTAV